MLKQEPYTPKMRDSNFNCNIVAKSKKNGFINCRAKMAYPEDFQYPSGIGIHRKVLEEGRPPVRKKDQTIGACFMCADPILDLAVIKIDPQGKLIAVLKLKTDMLPSVGEEVFAIGNPLGFEKTLTHGVISGVDRVLPISPMSMMVQMIQTDAPINPGNSGGPLIDRCGEVVGIIHPYCAARKIWGSRFLQPLLERCCQV